MTVNNSRDETSDMKNGRAADDLFRIFEEKIQSGALPEGTPMPPERELVQTYGVSRTVVREAILALANKGLVEARPRFRPVVRKPSYDTALEIVENIAKQLLNKPDGVKHLFETRIMIEASLVRQAAIDATKEDLVVLKNALGANAAAIDDSELFYKTDMAFHRVLYQVVDNPVLLMIHKAYITWLAPQWSQMPGLPERNRENYFAHKAIYDAILMRDPDTAEAALRRHLADAWEQVRKTFGDIKI